MCHRALKDANKVISLASDWPKGYFRKGKALAGLKVSILTTDKHAATTSIDLFISFHLCKCSVFVKVNEIQYMFNNALYQKAEHISGVTLK